MTVLQRWIIAVRGRSGWGFFWAASGLSVFAVTGWRPPLTIVKEA